MVATRQMISVPASIADWLGGGAERFWAAADGGLSDWLTRAIGAVLEHETRQFVGAAWHERAPQARKTYRGGYRPRRFMVLGRGIRLDGIRELRWRTRPMGTFQSPARDRPDVGGRPASAAVLYRCDRHTARRRPRTLLRTSPDGIGL